MISASDTAQTSFPTAELEARDIAERVLEMSRDDALAYLEMRGSDDIGSHTRSTIERLRKCIKERCNPWT